jgi:DNA-binding NarL/FixJ family response regulator
VAIALRTIDRMPRAFALDSTAESRAALLSRLSPGELEVLQLVSTGSTNREIGARLALSVYAVKFRLASAYRKLGVANRTEAASVLLTARNQGASPER